MIQHNLGDLQRYVTTMREASYADVALREYARGNRADPATVDAMHRQALKAAHLHAAACHALGIDPAVPHPIVERDVHDQIDQAGLWPTTTTKVRKQKNAPTNS